MKASVTTMISGFSGKLDGLVYYYNRHLQKFIVRKVPRFTPSEHTRRLGNIFQALAKLSLSYNYKQDFDIYLAILRSSNHPQGKNLLTWYNLFVKLMWKMKKVYGTDLESITVQQIREQNLPCISIKRAVEDGLLPYVNGYDRFDNEM